MSHSMRPFSAQVKEDKMGDLLSDARKKAFFHVCHKQNHCANT